MSQEEYNSMSPRGAQAGSSNNPTNPSEAVSGAQPQPVANPTSNQFSNGAVPQTPNTGVPQSSANIAASPQNTQPVQQPQSMANQNVAPTTTAFGQALVYPNAAGNNFGTAPTATPVQAGVAPNAPQGKKRIKVIVGSILGTIAAIFLIVGGVLLYRHFSGNVNGAYQINSLKKDLKNNLKDTTLSETDISYSDFTDNSKVEATIKDDVVKVNASYNVDYDSFYDTVKSGYSDENYTYKKNFSDDEWNYLINSYIVGNGFDEDGFDSTVSKSVEDNNFKYNSDQGQVSGTVFEGKVNRVSGKIEITKVNADSDLTDFEEGDEVSYKKTSSGLTLTDEDDNTIEFNLE
ncbi:hypothetical protein ACVR0S_03735 [Streptococcus dentapri]|uniref:Uncharacterized protein n=1 Tax=Streptococcus dentapri TaxID=573564 RepID=A0ABV8D1Q2_9STRE